MTPINLTVDDDDAVGNLTVGDDDAVGLRVTEGGGSGGGSTTGLTDDIIEALLNCFEHVAWVDDQGATYYAALDDALHNTTWSITNSLTHCATSNISPRVLKGGSYYATITASAGYTLTGATVSVTMGGTDITSTAYANGVINIAAVTGNVVITITAVEIHVELVSISAAYTQTSTVYPTTSLDSLKTDLVVTAHYDDSSTDTVAAADYTLSGTLTAGTSTVTVTYEDKTTTFNVTVSDVAELVSISAAYPEESEAIELSTTRVNGYISQSGTWTSSADSYSIAIPVTVGGLYSISWSETASGTVGEIFRVGFSSTNTASGQTLSGWRRLTPQTSSEITITASDAYLVIQVSAAYAETILTNEYISIAKYNTAVYVSDGLGQLKTDLVVTAHYSDGSSASVDVDDYTLSGSLTVGTSTVTVTYEGKTTTFNVAVTALYGLPVGAYSHASGLYTIEISKRNHVRVYKSVATSASKAYAVFIAKDGTTKQSNGTADDMKAPDWTTWFTTVASVPLNYACKNIIYNYTGSSSLTISTKWGRTNNTNLYSANLVLPSGSGKISDAEFTSASLQYSRDINSYVIDVPSNSATFDVEYDIEFTEDSARWF